MKNEAGGPVTSRPEKLNASSAVTIPHNSSGHSRHAVRFGPRFIDLERSANYLRALGATCLYAADTKRPEEILAAISVLRTLRLSSLEVRP
jgi:hypothetical protein